MTETQRSLRGDRLFPCKASNFGVKLRVSATSIFIDAEEEVHGGDVKRRLDIDHSARRGAVCGDVSESPAALSPVC